MFDVAALPSLVPQSVQWRICEMIASRPVNFLRLAFQASRDAVVAVCNLTIAN